MLRRALEELSNHYTYYVGLFIINAIIILLINFIVVYFTQSQINFNELKVNIQNLQDFQRLVDYVQENSQNLSPNTFSFPLIGWFQWFILSLLAILFNRSIYQKFANPALSISGSALFKTPILKAIWLPFKQFFTNFILIIFYLIIALIFGFILVEFGNSSLAILALLVIILLAVATIPVNQLLVYDINGNYNFFTTATKGLSLGVKNFFKIVGMLLVILLLLLVFGLLSSLIISLTSRFAIVGTILMVALYSLWLLPLILIYTSLNFHEIFQESKASMYNPQTFHNSQIH